MSTKQRRTTLALAMVAVLVIAACGKSAPQATDSVTAAEADTSAVPDSAGLSTESTTPSADETTAPSVSDSGIATSTGSALRQNCVGSLPIAAP